MLKDLCVYGIPSDGSAPFLMFIADMGEERAHLNAKRTRHLYTQKLAAYELRKGDAAPRRFTFEESSHV